MAASLHQSRREMLKRCSAVGAALIAPELRAAASPTPMKTRPIPRSGEALPVIGLGTYIAFDVISSSPEGARLKEVLQLFVDGGGRVVDTSPMYGRAEATLGTLASSLGLRPSLFVATKVWTSGAHAGLEQMRSSLRLLRTERIDLMQVHNLLDVNTHLKTLRAWKQAGTIRYLGITHYHAGAHRELEKLLQTRDYDFVQLNYSIGEREAEANLLPIAAEAGTAVIVNRPFMHGELFRKVSGLKLPAWAAEFDCDSWAQFFLKFIVSHPAVTSVIPASNQPAHMIDNLKAGRGALPDAKARKRMIDLMGGSQ
jgi:diketogulonate reductase-like aldo/keto reductase